MSCYYDKIPARKLFKEVKGFSDLQVEGIHSIMAWKACHASRRAAEHITVKKQKMIWKWGQALKSQGLPTKDPVPQVKFYLLKVPQPSTISPLAEDQEFKSVLDISHTDHSSLLQMGSVLPKCGTLVPKMMIFEDGNCVVRVELSEKRHQRSYSLSLLSVRWGYNVNMATCKPGCGPSPNHLVTR